MFMLPPQLALKLGCSRAGGLRGSSWLCAWDALGMQCSLVLSEPGNLATTKGLTKGLTVGRGKSGWSG